MADAPIGKVWHKARFWPKWRQWLIYGPTILLGAALVTLNVINAAAGRSPTSPLVAISITLPIIIVWMLALSGWMGLLDYAGAIGDQADGRAMLCLARGLLWLTIYVIVLPLISPIERLLITSRWIRPLIILGNHLPPLLMLVAVYYLLRGAKALSKLTPRPPGTSRQFAAGCGTVLGVLIVFSIYFYISQPRLKPIGGLPRFVMPLKLLLVTYLLPHLLAWGLGALACRHLAHYGNRVKGLIYRPIFRDLYTGLILVYIAIIAAQMVIVSGIRYANFALGQVLVYSLLLTAAAGFWLIRHGTCSLSRIETA